MNVLNALIKYLVENNWIDILHLSLIARFSNLRQGNILFMQEH